MLSRDIYMHDANANFDGTRLMKQLRITKGTEINLTFNLDQLTLCLIPH